ncbi:type I methionyl aminopeptidase [Jatrophihabitans sp.]|uniref:type I methionyl aminopeptidase n=1 Tax=Jatrophihabitans sp. TaxID=1932789 RepID=UPI0030C6B19E|nr:Methionine aminopeptidase [Jatrophihabitans sp.]
MYGAPERIELKSTEQILLMRQAGLVVANALQAMSEIAAPGVSTADLDAVARDVLADAGATSSFLHYDIGSGPYPAVICASVNDRIVHGIPSPQELLADGDLVSIDFGAIVEGWHGDAAVTVLVGDVSPEARAMSDACRESLWAGLAAARVNGRLTDISHAVESSVRKAGRYGIVAGYGGHGIGSSMHMAPHILNYGKAGKGPRLTHGMALAVEPMITLGSQRTQELDDGWTVSTVDGSWAAHWEHTVAVLDDGLWVLTAQDGGREELSRRGVAVSALAA